MSESSPQPTPARDVIERALPFSVYGGRMETADRIISALRAAGYVVVPRIPTKEMIVAGQDDHDGCVDSGYSSDADGNRYDYTRISPDAPAEVFKAMVDAADAEA